MATKKEAWNQIAGLETDLAWNANSLSAVQTGAGKFDIFDIEAREGVIDNRVRIDEIKDIIAGGVNFRGKTAETITDLATDLSIDMVGGSTLVVEAGKAGDMVIVPSTLTGKEDREFIWDGEKWNEFGNASNLKALAFADQTSASYTPDGTVTLSTENKTAALADGAATFNEVSVAATVAIDAYTPAGTISCDPYTPAGTISVDQITLDDTHITVNEVSSASFEQTNISVAAAFTGTEQTATVNVTPTTGTATFNGTLNQLPALTATGSVNALTAVTEQSAVAGTATVTNGVLSFTFVDALTGITTTTADVDVTVSPSYQNTLTSVADIALSTSGTVLSSVAGSVTLTPEGTVTTEQFTVSGDVELGIEEVENTIAGATLIPEATFTGTAATLGATFTGTAAAPTGTVTTTKFTPEATSITGNVTLAVPTSAGFTGTAATITGNPA